MAPDLSSSYIRYSYNRTYTFKYKNVGLAVKSSFCNESCTERNK